jgi:hypothetical protein
LDDALAAFFRFAAQYRFILSDCAFLAPSDIPWRAFGIHAGGFPRRLPRPAAMRSNTRMAWSMFWRSTRSSSIIFDKFSEH